jgi:hypothetical protein
MKTKPIQTSISSGRLLVEWRKGARTRRTPQRAVEIVDPAVERTDERVAASALLVGDDPRPPMAADVVEGPDRSLLVAQDQRPFTDHVEGDVAALVRQIGEVAGDLPVAAEDMLAL